jgi:outer membrane lipoprotein-sorting protein
MTRIQFVTVLAGTLAAAAAAGFGAPQAGNPLEATFARMDEAAATFKGLTANIRKLHHTDVVQKDELEEGTIAVKRMKAKDTRVRIDITKPEAKSYAIGEGKFRSFNPKSLEAQEADLGKSKDIVNQFMLLGFGSNSAELKSAYSVKLGDPDAVNGEKAMRLEMVPKNEEILKHVKRCDLWISDKGITVQQKFFETGGDYVLATYSHIAPSPSLPDSAVKLEIPKGVKITKLK